MEATTSTAADAQQLREVTERWMQGWNDQDADLLVAQLGDEFHYTDPAWPKPIADAAGVRAFTAACWRAMPDMHFSEPRGVFPSPDGRSACIPWHMTATLTGAFDPPGYAPTGDRIELDGVDIFELRDGRIARLATIYDAMEIGRAIGLIPPRGSRAERMGAKLQGLMARRRRR
jgi:steroid delta-isomerase-like uncharacterized protein